jgi:hypothetical protein
MLDSYSTLKWDSIVEELGMSGNTLRRHMKVYKFLDAFPRFLRSTHTFTSHLKYLKRLEGYFKVNQTESDRWSDVQA